MLDIKTLPDLFHRRTYTVEEVAGAYPDFEAGEMVELLYNSTLDELTIRKITGALTSPTSFPIFRDTEDRWDYAATHKTTVIEGEIVAETDIFVDALVGATEGTLLMVTTDGGIGKWAEATSGNVVQAVVRIGPTATAANGGILEYQRISNYVLP